MDIGPTVELGTPDVAGLADVVAALRTWQRDDAPVQLHPGDLGWFWRSGASATAAAVRTWSADGQLYAVGLLDGDAVLRLTVAPARWRDQHLSAQVLADVSDPERGVLPPGEVSVEAPEGTRVQQALDEAGWRTGESWTPLCCDLTEPVPPTGLRVEVVRTGQESEFTAVHRAAWGTARFSDAAWRAMAAGAPFADARCLLVRDTHGAGVAGVTVWSAGRGRPGLLEPLGVPAEHRGRGYGRLACLAAAAALRQLGSSSMWVCTPTSLTAAVATYVSAGLRPRPPRLDRTRSCGQVAHPVSDGDTGQ